jgi:hypothetical protein
MSVRKSSEQKIAVNDIKHYAELLENVINNYQFYPINTYDDIKEKLPYIREIRARHNYHNGQRKLLLSEVEFLTMYSKKAKYFIYAGSAPGWKNFYLSLLFPNLIFILIDPNPFEILIYENVSHMKKDNDYFKYLDAKKPESWISDIQSSIDTKIFIINDYYTNNTSENLKELKSILFNSDIRTNNDENDFPSNLEIVWNSAQQLNWISILKPIAYMLKFRVPYYMKDKIFPEKYQIDDFKYSKEKLGIDFIDIYNKLDDKFLYLDGTVYMQAFAGLKSTETRLISLYKEPIKFKTYNSVEYEQKCFYFNMIHRAYAYCYNPNSNKKIGFDHCQDCARENNIWDTYALSVNNSERVIDYVRALSSYSRRNFFKSNSPEFPIHGFMFDVDRQWYNERLKFSIPLKLNLQIPNRVEIQNNYTNLITLDIVLNESSKLLNNNNKQLYIDIVNKIPHEINEPCIYFKQLKNEIMPIYGAKFFRSCINVKAAGVTMNILQCLLIKSHQYVILDLNGRTEYINSSSLDIIAKALEVKILYINVNNGYDLSSVNKPGYYTIKNNLQSICKNKHIMDNGLLFHMHKTIDKEICNFSAEIYATNFIVIHETNFKSYLVPMLSYLDGWCLEKVDFNSEILKKSKSYGYDISKMFRKDGTFTYFDDDLLVIPYGVYVTANYRILVSKSTKMKEYDISKINSKGFYQNTFSRTFQVYKNKYVDNKYGFDNCFDCSITSAILDMFMVKINISSQDKREFCIKFLKKIFGRSLYNENHGYLYNYDESCIINAFVNELITRKLMRNNKTKI